MRHSGDRGTPCHSEQRGTLLAPLTKVRGDGESSPPICRLRHENGRNNSSPPSRSVSRGRSSSSAASKTLNTAAGQRTIADPSSSTHQVIPTKTPKLLPLHLFAISPFRPFAFPFTPTRRLPRHRHARERQAHPQRTRRLHLHSQSRPPIHRSHSW